MRLALVERLTRVQQLLIESQAATIALQAGLIAANSVATNAQASHSGTAVLDFGSSPASETTIVVTGQTGIQENTRIRTWLSNERHMTDNDENSHLMAGTFIRLVAGSVVANTSFVIYATAKVGLCSGRFRADWIWSA